MRSFRGAAQSLPTLGPDDLDEPDTLLHTRPSLLMCTVAGQPFGLGHAGSGAGQHYIMAGCDPSMHWGANQTEYCFPAPHAPKEPFVP